MDNPLLKYSAKEYFFKAALCHFIVDELNAKVGGLRVTNVPLQRPVPAELRSGARGAAARAEIPGEVAGILPLGCAGNPFLSCAVRFWGWKAEAGRRPRWGCVSGTFRISPLFQLALEKYEEMFPAFTDSRECKLLKVSEAGETLPTALPRGLCHPPGDVIGL